MNAIEALRELLNCANAIVGADVHDPEAAEAFEMFNSARIKAREALSTPPSDAEGWRDLLEQCKRDFAAAHTEICKLQKIDPAKHTWPQWSSVAHTLAWIDKALARPSSAGEKDGTFDFLAHLARQRAFSEKTFGPGTRTQGVIDHIRKELGEIEANPADISEWIDVVILALDGAWRAGFQPQEIIDALVAKQDKNEARQWPDWRTAAPDKAIEHINRQAGN